MARPKAQDLPGVEGEGVAPVKDKKLEALADSFVDKRDEKAQLAEQMTAIESKIIDRMVELGTREFKYADKVVTIKIGATHAKVKTVTADGVEEDAD